MTLSGTFNNLTAIFLILVLIPLFISIFVRTKKNVSWVATTFTLFLTICYACAEIELYSLINNPIIVYAFPLFEILIFFACAKIIMKLTISNRFGWDLSKTIMSVSLMTLYVLPILNICLTYMMGIIKINMTAYYTEIQEMLYANEIYNITPAQYLNSVIIPQYTVSFTQTLNFLIIPFMSIALTLYILWKDSSSDHKNIKFTKAFLFFALITINVMYRFGQIGTAFVYVAFVAILLTLILLWRTYEHKPRPRIAQP